MYQLLPKGVLHLPSGQAIPPDLSNADWQTYRAWLKAGNTPLPPTVRAPPAPSVADIIATVTLATQARLDDFARSRGYDSIHTAAAYASSKKAKFAKEGQTAVDAMSNTWAALYVIMAAVQAGTRPMPASFADVDPDLPALVWPQ